jgi:hypothetical protein
MAEATPPTCPLTNAAPTQLASPKTADSPSLQVTSAVSQVERSGDTLPMWDRGIISMNSDIGFLELEESKGRSG